MVEIDVEHDGLYLRHLLHDTGYPDIADLIKKALDSVIPRKAIDFRANVARVITQCLQSNGVPMFRTRYAKEPFPGNTVLMVCYMGRLKGVWLKDTPTDDRQLLRSKADGYTLMLRKYGQYPAGAVRMGGAAAYTGQVSEATGDLDYFINGEKVGYEEFEKAWIRELPNQPMPRQPFYTVGKTHTFTITVPFKRWPAEEEIKQRIQEISPLEAHLMEIETGLKDALADEEKAVPFYQELKNDIERIITLIPKDMTKENTLFSMQLVVDGIIRDEGRHRDSITKMIPVIKELRKTLELERYTGKRQVQRPLERV